MNNNYIDICHRAKPTCDLPHVRKIKNDNHVTHHVIGVYAGNLAPRNRVMKQPGVWGRSMRASIKYIH